MEQDMKVLIVKFGTTMETVYSVTQDFNLMKKECADITVCCMNLNKLPIK